MENREPTYKYIITPLAPYNKDVELSLPFVGVLAEHIEGAFQFHACAVPFPLGAIWA